MSSGIASTTVSGAVTALSGAETVASAIVNGVAGAAVEAHNQYSIARILKRKGEGRNKIQGWKLQQALEKQL